MYQRLMTRGFEDIDKAIFKVDRAALLRKYVDPNWSDVLPSLQRLPRCPRFGSLIGVSEGDAHSVLIAAPNPAGLSRH